MLRPLLKYLPMLALTTVAAAYDYNEPIPCVKALPIELPEQPFVLRFSEEELLAQPIWSNRIDGIVITNKAASPIRVGAEALRASLAKLLLGDAPILEVAPDERARSPVP